jgi:hypothetical protein
MPRDWNFRNAVKQPNNRSRSAGSGMTSAVKDSKSGPRTAQRVEGPNGESPTRRASPSSGKSAIPRDSAPTSVVYLETYRRNWPTYYYHVDMSKCALQIKPSPRLAGMVNICVTNFADPRCNYTTGPFENLTIRPDLPPSCEAEHIAFPR